MGFYQGLVFQERVLSLSVLGFLYKVLESLLDPLWKAVRRSPKS